MNELTGDTSMPNRPTEEQPKSDHSSAKNNGKKSLIAIIVVSILPVALAYFMFFTGIGVPEQTVNNGHFLAKPINVEKLLQSSEPELLQSFKDDKKWRILLPISQSCNKACQDNLYTTRQVHVRLGEKGLRVERFAVNFGEAQGNQFLDSIAADHPILKIASVSPNVWKNWISAAGTTLGLNENPYYLLVDQEGFAMMYYTSDIHGNLLLKDIKRALKYSIDYQ